MAWVRESITEGELDALRQAAQRAWADDTCYPGWRGSSRMGGGQCYVSSRWLVERLGGYVGVREGHYAWVSPDGGYVIDLTADHGNGVVYVKNPGYERHGSIDNPRTERFIRRANRIFDNLGDLLKVSLDYMGDAYPAEEPQADEDSQYWHDEPSTDPGSGEYKFVYGNGGLEVSPAHDHQELAEHAGLSGASTGPVAVGWVTLTNGRATWEVQTNVNIKALERVFKDYGKHVGWQWGGITSIEGQPISDEFAPTKTSLLRWAYAADHLYLGRLSHSELLLQAEAAGEEDVPVAGWIRLRGSRADVWPVHVAAIPSLCEWAQDSGLTLYATAEPAVDADIVPDLQQFNLGDNSNELPPPQKEERSPAGLYQCPVCNRLFPSWHTYQEHRRTEETQNPEPIEDGGFPELDQDATFPPHQTESQPMVMPVAGYREAARVAGFEGGRESDEFWVAYHYGSPIGYAQLREGKLYHIHCARDEAYYPLFAKLIRYTDQQPKDLLSAPVPFIYDVQEDNITVGHQGQRTSDIPGQFTPGGIVEGTYEPGGKVVIRSMTNMPYTVRHMVELWYYQHPELEVKSVNLRDQTGGDTKLASTEIGDKIAGLVAGDSAVREAALALRQAGGQVYAVGGAVRDVVMGKDPKDIDLMVTGLPANVVQAVLRQLPGKVDYTGRDFGVFRYREYGNEVEIALPRREHSTGDGHQDFDVQADHTMSPQEDFFRRDFTANAMGVNLSNGQLIDPHGGVEDINRGILRSVNPAALSEDPLRVVRALVAKARHGLHPDRDTQAQMAANAESLQHLTPERIQMELDKLFASQDPANAIRLAHETGVLKHLLPEVDEAFGYDQNNPHHELELGDHLTNVLERMCQKTNDPDLRLAALLHDIGKPASQWTDPETGQSHFYEKHLPDGTVLGADHEVEGANMARSLMGHLRYPTDRIKRVSELIEHHMWPSFTSTKGARKFLNRVGPHADDLMDLRWADQGGKSQYPTDPTMSLDTQRRLIEQSRNANEPVKRDQLAVNGNDLLAVGVPQGPQMGAILQALMNAVIEDPRLNQRDKLLALAQQYAR